MSLYNQGHLRATWLRKAMRWGLGCLFLLSLDLENCPCLARVLAWHAHCPLLTWCMKSPQGPGQQNPSDRGSWMAGSSGI
jgi:hypothetical protein